MILKKVYKVPVAEKFAVEEDGRLLDTSFNIVIGGDGDFGESKPIGGFTLESDVEDINSSQIWHN